MTGPFTAWKGHFLSYICSIHQGDSTPEIDTVDGIIGILLLGLFVINKANPLRDNIMYKKLGMYN